MSRGTLIGCIQGTHIWEKLMGDPFCQWRIHVRRAPEG